MPIDAGKIERLRRELEEAERQLLLEDGQRYKILKRIIPDAEMERFLAGLTDRGEKVLFGLELPEEPRRRGRPPGGGARPATSGGDLTCPICGKAGLTKRGLALHMARIHKGEQAQTEEEGGEA